MSTRCVLLASKNPGKIRNFTMAFAELGIACRPVDSVTALKIEEHAVTPEENALLKARAHWQPGTIVLGDDAGLEIDALGGEPGIQARRWNGRFPDTVDDDTWLDYLLKRLEGVPLEKRTARFVSGWALIGPNGESDVMRYEQLFIIAEKRIRPMKPGLPMTAVTIEQVTKAPLPLPQALAAWPFLRRVLQIDLVATGNA